MNGLLTQHGDQAVNAQLKREADFYGDVVIVPYMDRYQLLVLKTVAIIEHGVGEACLTCELLHPF